MNLLLLEQEDFVGDNEVLLKDRRFAHLKDIHQAERGDSLRVGMLNGLMGEGEILDLTPDSARIKLQLHQPAHRTVWMPHAHHRR